MQILTLLWISVSASSAAEVMSKVLEVDPWGLSQGEVTAHAQLTDKRGTNKDLAFSARSLRYAPALSKSTVRFSQPADLSGAGFLQIQQQNGDDDRHLFLPELKKSRRISGNLRANAFMGTDFSFADLDRRDLREGAASLGADETFLGKPCFRLSVVPKSADSQYAHIELWVRKDTFVPLKWEMYDKANVLLKTLTAEEIKRVGGSWFITRSTMVNHKESHTTKLVIDTVNPTAKVMDDEFTLKNLEKL